jgi:non-ribosomal peptide synthetase component F
VTGPRGTLPDSVRSREDWNATAVRYRPEATIHGLFREIAAAHPERVALQWPGGELSYEALNELSDELSERLILAGVEADAPVGLALPRSPAAVIAMLAILKAGTPPYGCC